MTSSITIPESAYVPKYTLDEILFPKIEPNLEGYLRVSDIHEIWYAEYGNLQGTPVIFVHGGPGGGVCDDDARFFNPKHYRIILFDQRGAKRSRPLYEMAENNTHNLINDMEKLRKHLGIDKWLALGGSWGSTLSVLYGQTYPEHCLGFVLRGIFTATDEEISNIYAMGDIFPENYNELVSLIPENERGDLLNAYFKRLCDPDPKICMEAARIFMKYDLEAAFLMNSKERVQKILAEEDIILAVSKFFAHYALNRFFLEPNQIMDELYKISHLPAIIVHGRYDIICRVKNAYKMHKNWPGSELVIIQDAGHSDDELGTAKALVYATEKMWSKLNK